MEREEAKLSARRPPILHSNDGKGSIGGALNLICDHFGVKNKLMFGISFPTIATAASQKVKDGLDNLGKSSISWDTDTTSWLFVPSFRRAESALLRFLEQVLDESRPVLIFVQPEEFKRYRKFWGRTHVIVAVPEGSITMDYGRGISDPVTLERRQNGVGFQRLCIQMFAYAMKLSWIFQLDDNFHSCYEYDNDGKPHPVPFEKVMTCIEYIARNENREKKLSELDYLPPGVRNDSKSINDIMDTGVDDIALIGIRRGEFCIESEQLTPISCTHSIYSFVAINIKASCQKKIFYPAKR